MQEVGVSSPTVQSPFRRGRGTDGGTLVHRTSTFHSARVSNLVLISKNLCPWVLNLLVLLWLSFFVFSLSSPPTTGLLNLSLSTSTMNSQVSYLKLYLYFAGTCTNVWYFCGLCKTLYQLVYRQEHKELALECLSTLYHMGLDLTAAVIFVNIMYLSGSGDLAYSFNVIFHFQVVS